MSALGSDQTVIIPSDKPDTSVDAIAEKISVVTIDDYNNIVCITETKGHLRNINEIARRHNARAIIHTGDFGFYDSNSYQHLSNKELRSTVQFAPLTHQLRARLTRLNDYDLRKECQKLSLSELELFLSGKEHFEVPVYVIWGNQEDVEVLKKFSDGSYHIPNLYILNQDSSYTIAVEGQTVRLFGLGGAILYHRFFDIGQGNTQVCGSEGIVWSTLIQIGSLLELAERYKDHNEIRILVSHVCPGKEGLVNILATALNVDFTISGALHGKFCHAYTDFSIRTLNNYLEHLNQAKTEIPRLWSHVVDVVGEVNIRDSDRMAIERVLQAIKREPQSDQDLKHIWHLNLTDIKNGHLVLKLKGDEMRFEPFIEQGWHLSVARRQSFVQNNSSRGRRASKEKITPHITPFVEPKSIKEQATVVPTETGIAEITKQKPVVALSNAVTLKTESAKVEEPLEPALTK